MLQLRIALIVILLAGAGGGYLYVTKLQKDNAILKTNQVKLESAVQESNQVIEQQTKDLKKIRSTLKKVEEVAKNSGIDKIALQVENENIVAFNFYEKSNYREVDRRPSIPFPGSQDSGDYILMSKCLD